MGLLARLFGPGIRLDEPSRNRLDMWRALPEADLSAPFETARYVVVDVETTGLNLVKDRLIAIGACAVTEGRIDLKDSFEVVIRQDKASSKDNILIHGIGGEAQRDGMAPTEALQAFLEFVAKSPLLAFHVTFDKTMIDRALKTFLGLGFNHPWADLAYLAPALYPELARSHRSLDHWMARFGISNYARHSALADALSTAELLLALRGQMSARHIVTFSSMRGLEKAQRMTAWTG